MTKLQSMNSHDVTRIASLTAKGFTQLSNATNNV